MPKSEINLKKGLVSSKQLHNSLTSDMALRWIRDGLSRAEFYSSMYKAHSGKFASSDKDRVIGISVRDKLNTGTGKKECT